MPYSLSLSPYLPLEGVKRDSADRNTSRDKYIFSMSADWSVGRCAPLYPSLPFPSSPFPSLLSSVSRVRHIYTVCRMRNWLRPRSFFSPSEKPRTIISQDKPLQCVANIDSAYLVTLFLFSPLFFLRPFPFSHFLSRLH